MHLFAPSGPVRDSAPRSLRTKINDCPCASSFQENHYDLIPKIGEEAKKEFNQ